MTMPSDNLLSHLQEWTKQHAVDRQRYRRRTFVVAIAGYTGLYLFLCLIYFGPAALLSPVVVAVLTWQLKGWELWTGPIISINGYGIDTEARILQFLKENPTRTKYFGCGVIKCRTKQLAIIAKLQL